MSNYTNLRNAVKAYANARRSAKYPSMVSSSSMKAALNRAINDFNGKTNRGSGMKVPNLQTARISVGPSSLNTVKQKLTTLAQRVKGIKVPDRFLAFFRRAKANIAAGNAQAAAANTNKAAAEVGLPPPLPPKPNSMRVPTNNNKVNNKAAAASNWLRNLGNPTNNNKAAAASNSKRRNNAKREMSKIPNF
jgi:hypothetical protein